MAYPIYSSPSYSLGSVDVPSIVPSATKAQAEKALKSMQGSLKGWLKVRKKLDDYAAGKGGKGKLPPAVVAATLQRDRAPVELDLALQLHALLIETGCGGAFMPDPHSPNAAVKLAEIVLGGTCPSDPYPGQAQPLGIVWFVLAIPIAGVVLVLSQIIKSKADVAKHQADLVCIQSGACTDTGFWLKVASVGVVAWIVWDKMGLKHRFAKK